MNILIEALERVRFIFKTNTAKKFSSNRADIQIEQHSFVTRWSMFFSNVHEAQCYQRWLGKLCDKIKKNILEGFAVLTDEIKDETSKMKLFDQILRE
jgi:hypothetical protein